MDSIVSSGSRATVERPLCCALYACLHVGSRRSDWSGEAGGVRSYFVVCGSVRGTAVPSAQNLHAALKNLLVCGSDFVRLYCWQAYYTLFDVENLRVGFACTGNGCSGGTWHGQGGFIEIEEQASWQR